MLPNRTHPLVWLALVVLVLTSSAAYARPSATVPRLGGLLWSAATDGAVRTSPVVVGDAVIVAGTDGAVRALDLRDGRERWRVDLGAPIVATPAVAGDTVYVVDRRNALHALDAGDGALRWRLDTGPDLPLPWGFEGWDYVAGGPVVLDGIVYFGSGDGGLYAVAAADGRELWRFDAGARFRAAPTPHGERIYIGAGDGRLHALDRATGGSVWTFVTEGHDLDAAAFGFDRRQIYSAAVVSDGTVYFGSRDAGTYALDAETGQQRWRSDDGTSAWVIAAPWIDGELLLETRSSSTRVRALRRDDGSEVWSAVTGGAVFAPVVPLGGGFLAANGSGLLIAYDRDGAERWRYGVGTGTWSAPTVLGDRLLVGSDDGSVYALALESGPAPLLGVYADPDVAAVSMLGAAPGHAVIADYFAQRGYRRLDSEGLATFLQERVEDGRPSAVVFAVDGPDPALEGGEESLLLRYLRSGGRVVWLGQPPGLLQRNEEGQIVGLDREVPSALLGVDHGPLNTDRYPVWPTAEGRERGLLRWRIWSPRINAGPATVVLARDELGGIAAWEQPYGPGRHGRPGAFVSLWPAFAREGLDEIRAVAEYGLYRFPTTPDLASSADRGVRRP